MINKNPLKIVWLDTETTGLDEKEHDIVQIAGIIDIDTIPAEHFNYRVQPRNWESIQDKALESNGFTRDQLRGFAEPNHVHKHIISHLERYIDRYDREDKAFIAGQNPGFDRDFLKEFFVKSGDKFFGSWFDYHVIDLVTPSLLFHIKGIVDLRQPNGRISVKLRDVAKAFGLEQKEPHDALDDIMLTRKIFYEHMLDRFF